LAVKQRPISREHLAALFWPDEESAKGRSNLRRELHNLSKLLPNCWDIDRQYVAFEKPENISFDLDLIKQWESERRYDEAAALIGGEFMEGLSLDIHSEFETWLQQEREFWHQTTENILEKASHSNVLKGNFHQALRFTRQLLEITPWKEDAHQQMMKLLSWTGKDQQALRQYAICKKILNDELEVDPSPETGALYQQIKNGTLPPPPHRPGFLTMAEPEKLSRAFSFVGREQEIQRLKTALTDAVAGDPQFIFVAGNPGQGKTTLLDAFTKRAMEANPDVLVARGNCNALSGIGDPYLPFREMMGMLTGDVEALWGAGSLSTDHAARLWLSTPTVVEHLLACGRQVLDVIVPQTHLAARCQDAAQRGMPWVQKFLEYAIQSKQKDSEFEQSYLFQQFTNVVTATSRDQPLVMILDDIQWADSASISMLFHLGRRVSNISSRILVICAYRPLEIQTKDGMESHPLDQVLNEFKRMYGDIWIHLGEEPDEQRKMFVDSLLDSEPNVVSEDFRLELFNRTNGHPLFTVELLRTMQDRGDVYRDENDIWQERQSLDWTVLPSRIEAVMADRIRHLNPTLQKILSVASVIGETFTSDLIAGVLDLDVHEVTYDLSQKLAAQHKLVNEEGLVPGQPGAYRYQFRHILYQEYLYQKMSSGKKHLFHEKVARLMENAHSEDFAALAYHTKSAGMVKKALQYFILAGERALEMYANHEAEDYFLSALEMVGEDWGKANIIAGLSEAIYRQSRFKETIELCLQGIDLFLVIGDLDQVAKLYARIENSEYYRGNTSGSLGKVQEGLQILENAPDSDGKAMFLNNAVRAYVFNELLEEGMELSEKALAMAENVGSLSTLADAMTSKCLAMTLSNPDAGIISALYEKVIDITESNGLTIQAARAYSNLGAFKKPSEALKNHEKAVLLSQQTGMLHFEFFFANNELSSLSNLGRLNQATERLAYLLKLAADNHYGDDKQNRLSMSEGRLLGFQGYLDKAVGLLLPYLEKTKETGDNQNFVMSGNLLADFYLGLGKIQESKKILIEILDKFGVASIFQPRILLSLVSSFDNCLEDAQGWLDEADQYSLKIQPISLSDPICSMWAKASLFALKKQWEVAWETYSGAIEQAEQLGYRWLMARIMMAWAEAHITRGGEYCSHGGLLLKKVQDEFEDMGAFGWVQRIKDQRKKLGL
jgi:DNA-binding SARP family transcriptional activator